MKLGPCLRWHSKKMAHRNFDSYSMRFSTIYYTMYRLIFEYIMKIMKFFITIVQTIYIHISYHEERLKTNRYNLRPGFS